MENAPLDTDPSPESDITGEKSRDKKKRRKSHDLGRAAIDVDKKPSKEEKPGFDWFKSEKSKSESVIFAPKEENREEVELKDAEQTNSEAEAPADGTLSPEEEQTVIQAIAQEVGGNIPEHNAEKELEEAAGDILAAEFYDKLQQDPDIEKAAREVVEEAGLELPEDALELPDEPVEVAPEEELVFERQTEVPSLDNEILDEESDVPAATTSSGIAASTPPTQPGHGGAGVPSGPQGPGGFAGGPHVPVGGPSNFNYAPPPAPMPNQAPTTSNERLDDRGHPAVFFVAGGIVGYLMGKRRWKKKGAAEVKKVRAKLEKQVEDLSWQIKAKETKIREVAAQKVRQEGPAVVEVLAAKRTQKVELAKPQMPKPEAISLNPERIIETRQKAPEARILHTPKAPEHIGQMLVSVESAPIIPKPEQPGRIELEPTAEKAKPALHEKAAETLSRSELLQLSEQIKVEDSTLRQIFETNLVSEKGLRRLVAEHLRGGDVAKALRREIVEREIDFERDPAMRDIAPADTQSSGNTGGAVSTNSLNAMLEKAAANLPTSSEEAAFYKARAAYEVDQSNKQRKRQQVIDASFGGVILALLAAVIYLFITRG